MEKQSQLSVKSRVIANAYSSLSISEALKEYAVAMSSKSTNTSSPFNWIELDIPLPKPEKVLTEKQLFSKIKKELKEVKSLIN